MPTVSLKDYLPIKDAVRLIGINPATLHRWDNNMGSLRPCVILSTGVGFTGVRNSKCS